MAGKTIGSLLIKLGMDAKDADRSLKQFERKLRDTGRAMESIGKKMTVGLTAPIVGFGIAAVKAASDAEETFSKFSVVFSKVAADAEKSFQILRNQYGLSSKTAKQLLSDTGDLLTGFGFSQEAALELSTEVNKLAVDLASFTNFSGGAEGASQALTKALLGERESVKALGIAILESDVKAQVAINSAKGMTFETERQAKAYATLELAMGQSKNAIGDYARTSDSFANQFRLLKERTNDLSVEFGKILLPLVTHLTQGITKLVDSLSKMDDETKKATVGIAMMAAAAGPLLIALPKIVGYVTAMISPAGLWAGAFIAVGAAILYIIENWDALEKRLNSTKIGAYLAENVKSASQGKFWEIPMNMIKQASGTQVGNYTTGPGGRAQSWYDAGKTLKTPGETLEGIGKKVFDWVSGGFNLGQTLGGTMGAGYTMTGAAMPGEGGETDAERLKKQKEAREKELDKLLINHFINYEEANREKLETQFAVIGALRGEDLDIGGLEAFQKGSKNPLGISGGSWDDLQSGITGINPDMEGATRSATEALEQYQSTWTSVADGVSGAVSTMAQALADGENAFAAFAQSALLSAAKVAKAAMVETLMGVIKDGALKGGGPGAIIGLAVGIGLISMLESKIASMKAPALARGGVTNAPTMALIGDNPSGKEMVLPFERSGEFAGMIAKNMGGSGGGTLSARIAGDDLEFILTKATQKSARMGRPSVINF